MFTKYDNYCVRRSSVPQCCSSQCRLLQCCSGTVLSVSMLLRHSVICCNIAPLQHLHRDSCSSSLLTIAAAYTYWIQLIPELLPYIDHFLSDIRSSAYLLHGLLKYRPIRLLHATHSITFWVNFGMTVPNEIFDFIWYSSQLLCFLFHFTL